MLSVVLVLALSACSAVFTFEPDTAPALSIDTAPPPEPPPSHPVINEVQTANDSTVMDRTLAFPDWVELYNPDTDAIDLAEVTLSDGDATWTGAGTLAPGERLLLWADAQDLPGHLPFSLDKGGAELTLSLGDTVVDRLATGRMAGDTAWARYPDGGEWAYTARPTPDATNGSDPGPSIDPSDALFPEDDILTFELTIPTTSWDALAYDPYGEVPASLAWGPAWFGDVSVRLKGVYGSLRSLSAKAAFKVDLNAYADHRLRGLETLTFNNMVQDPTYTHEALAYAYFRAMGLPAPRTAWMRLRVNGEDWGLYLHVESVDDTFLARWWADPSGRLYEGSYGDDFTIGEEYDFEYDEGPELDDRSSITTVATILDGAPTDAQVDLLEQWVDLDQVLRELAVEAVLWHWDGYTTANNYRVYQNPDSGLFEMIPWGTDQVLHDEWYGPYDGIGELLNFCIANAGCLERYNAALLDAADTFEAGDYADQMDAWTLWLAEQVANDPRGEHAVETQATYRETTRRIILESPGHIRLSVSAP